MLYVRQSAYSKFEDRDSAIHCIFYGIEGYMCGDVSLDKVMVRIVAALLAYRAVNPFAIILSNRAVKP